MLELSELELSEVAPEIHISAMPSSRTGYCTAVRGHIWPLTAESINICPAHNTVHTPSGQRVRLGTASCALTAVSSCSGNSTIQALQLTISELVR
jgi:hypothetical protein